MNEYTYQQRGINEVLRDIQSKLLTAVQRVSRREWSAAPREYLREAVKGNIRQAFARSLADRMIITEDEDPTRYEKEFRGMAYVFSPVELENLLRELIQATMAEAGDPRLWCRFDEWAQDVAARAKSVRPEPVAELPPHAKQLEAHP